MRDAGTDVIVVGAGAAGCVIARRLADAGRSVTLLEAGPDLRSDPAVDLHDGWRLPTTSDWGFRSESRPGGESKPLRRVKGVGGTGWMTRFAVRGSSLDFDRWAAAGNPGWSFDEIMPTFRTLENDLDFGDRPWHGDQGPIPITRYPAEPLTDVHAAAVEAAHRQGFDWVEDQNAPDAVGIGRMPMSSRAGRRVTSADAYLPDGDLPRTLRVRTDAEVARVSLKDGRATGVRLTDGEAVHGDLIVLAAGTYGSPVILLRSGIGPAEELRTLSVPTEVDLPGVGANLADHPEIDVDLGWNGPSRAIPLLHTLTTFRSEACAASDPPDLMLWIVDPFGDPVGFEIDVVLLKPHARGRVRLRSADPATAPIIELPIVDEERDVPRLMEGFRRASAIANDPAVRRWCANAPTSMPARDSALASLIRANEYSIPHVVGTCRMGPDPRAGAVVDSDGRVHGVDGLYVVDASIIPEAPAGFPHLITLMLAEVIAGQLVTTR